MKPLKKKKNYENIWLADWILIHKKNIFSLKNYINKNTFKKSKFLGEEQLKYNTF